tara:strand:- start:1724 stop:1933 length:210 start_codon:yes stop_codon:yes gene_type:complete
VWGSNQNNRINTLPSKEMVKADNSPMLYKMDYAVRDNFNNIHLRIFSLAELAGGSGFKNNILNTKSNII